jgi:protein-histidine pros-kinase
MMETALAIRAYTVSQIKPHLDPMLAEQFLPQTVPAYAATETLNELRKNHPEYAYKEATLNPSNPRDRASDWEADLVAGFRNAMDVKELTGERDTPTGRHMYIARPIQITNPACLACHNTPATAPPSMVKVYGEANGFGWKMNEIIGAQVVSVPMTVPVANADRAFTTFMASLLGVFVFVMVALNLMLEWLIIRPVARMSAAADRISTGDFSVPEFGDGGRDEVSVLGASFNRMRRSLETAMRMIDS